MIEFLVYIVVSLISTFGFSYLYYKLTGATKKINLKITFMFVIGVILIALVKYFNVTVISVFSYFLYFPFLFREIKYTLFTRFLFYVIIVWIFGEILDIFSMFIMLIFQSVFDINIYSYTFRIISSFLVFIIFIIVARNVRFRKFVEDAYRKVQKISYFDFAIVVFAIFAFFVGLVIFLNLDNINVSILLMAVLFLLSLSFGLLVGVRVQLIENNIFLKTLKKNNDFYLKIEDENRIFKHNLIAKLLAIKSVSNKRARELIDDYIASFNNNMDFSVHIKEIPYGLNGIIYEKVYRYIGKLDIKIDNKIEFDLFERLKSRRYNVFVEKLIIAIDNAIESSLTSVDKILVINLYSENDNVIVDIKNSFSADLDLDKIGSLNYSTKKDEKKKRGLGLFSALRNNEVIMQLNIINNLFVIKIIAKQKSDVSE